MTAVAVTASPTFEPDQVFLPGGIWFYAKLYTDVDLITELASRHLPSALTYLFGLPVSVTAPGSEPSQAGSEQLWFFVRYTDPGHHLRLRIRLSSDNQAPDALQALRVWGEKLRDANLISRAELGTYEQETHRYGGRGNVELAERVFSADSAECVGLLAGPYRDEIVPQMASRIAAIWTAAADPDVHRAAVSGALLAQKYAAAYEEKAAAVRLHRDRATPSATTHLERETRALYRRLRESGISAERRVYIARSLAHMHANRAGATTTTERRALDAATSIMRSLDRTSAGHR